jgi:pimeloyl-ACP methyl ester carboxylesterase
MRFLLVIAIAACSAPKPVPTPARSEQPQCEREPAAGEHGRANVRATDGTTHALYWRRLTAKTQPAHGTLFYLAGGPQSHLEYTQLAAAFQQLAFPALDVVVYDYFGWNCSTALQQVPELARHVRGLTMAAMANDFIGLKRELAGAAKVYVMGGSHGAMLGAQIVATYPDDIAKAVLFSGDLASGWLAEGWFRFDALLAQLAARDAAFAADLERLFAKADAGELAVEVQGARRVVTRPALEVALWLAAGLESEVQAALPVIVKLTLDGDLEALAAIYGAERELLAAPTPAPPPTDSSVALDFYRCNVWFPRSARAASALVARRTRYLAYRSFAEYWNELCAAYDPLGEFPYDATPARPTAVPVLAWIGDRDTFDPDATRARFARLSTRAELHVMPGWAHDFGPDPEAGFRTLATLVAGFLR